MNAFFKSDFRLRAIVATALICCSFAFAALAYTKTQQQRGKAKCDGNLDACYQKCQGLSGLGDDIWNRCNANCELSWLNCYKRIGLSPDGTPPPRIGGLPTPTPRPGPSATAPPNKSNPTPIPKKGPGKVGTSGIGHSSPSPTASVPVLLKKSNTPTPTPHSSSKKGHH